MISANLNSDMHLLVHTLDQPAPIHSQIRFESGDVYASMVNASVG